jgi:hypothetical protein
MKPVQHCWQTAAAMRWWLHRASAQSVGAWPLCAQSVGAWPLLPYTIPTQVPRVPVPSRHNPPPERPDGGIFHSNRFITGNLPRTNPPTATQGIANGRGTVAVEWKHHRRDRLKRRRDLSVEVSVLKGWDPKVLLVRPSPFPSALIQRGDSWPPLPRVELIQKVSTKHPEDGRARVSWGCLFMTPYGPWGAAPTRSDKRCCRERSVVAGACSTFVDSRLRLSSNAKHIRPPASGVAGPGQGSILCRGVLQMPSVLASVCLISVAPLHAARRQVASRAAGAHAGQTRGCRGRDASRAGPAGHKTHKRPRRCD